MMIELVYTPRQKYIKLTADHVSMDKQRVLEHKRALEAALAWLEQEEQIDALERERGRSQDEESKEPEGQEAVGSRSGQRAG